MAEPLDLQKSGLLWLINRCVFHPRGFALGVTEDNLFCLLGDGREPWRFELDDEDELFARAEATLRPRAL